MRFCEVYQLADIDKYRYFVEKMYGFLNRPESLVFAYFLLILINIPLYGP